MIDNNSSVYCHECGRKTEVTDSRISKGLIRRRRYCGKCNISFTTKEITDSEYTLLKRYKRAILNLKKGLKEI